MKFTVKQFVQYMLITLSLLTVCGCIVSFIIIKNNIDSNLNSLNCFNYCMDSLWSSHLSGIVVNSNTMKPIIGASVIITDSETQFCDTCPGEMIGVLRLQTDERGHFVLPFGARRSYRLNIRIEADNCDVYIRQYRAFELEAPNEGMVGENFELTCLAPTQQTPEN